MFYNYNLYKKNFSVTLYWYVLDLNLTNLNCSSSCNLEYNSILKDTVLCINTVNVNPIATYMHTCHYIYMHWFDHRILPFLMKCQADRSMMFPCIVCFFMNEYLIFILIWK